LSNMELRGLSVQKIGGGFVRNMDNPGKRKLPVCVADIAYRPYAAVRETHVAIDRGGLLRRQRKENIQVLTGCFGRFGADDLFGNFNEVIRIMGKVASRTAGGDKITANRCASETKAADGTSILLAAQMGIEEKGQAIALRHQPHDYPYIGGTQGICRLNMMFTEKRVNNLSGTLSRLKE